MGEANHKVAVKKKTNEKTVAEETTLGPVHIKIIASFLFRGGKICRVLVFVFVSFTVSLHLFAVSAFVSVCVSVSVCLCVRMSLYHLFVQ